MGVLALLLLASCGRRAVRRGSNYSEEERSLPEEPDKRLASLARARLTAERMRLARLEASVQTMDTRLKAKLEEVDGNINHYRRSFPELAERLKQLEEWLGMHGMASPIPIDCARVSVDLRDVSACRAYEKLPLVSHVNCSGRPRVVPRIYHSAAGTPEPPRAVRMNSGINPEYRVAYHNDSSAAAYVRAFCGHEAAQAYNCFAAPAYRADTFRFCALFAEGGLYMDTDIITLKPMDDLYLPCRNTTMGHDYPPYGYRATKQMKILAGAPRGALFKCMLKRIIEGVRNRTVPENPLGLSGPIGLQACYEETPSDIALTYLDARRAAWPYTGMRTRDDLLAYERPNRKRHLQGTDNQDYSELQKLGSVGMYREACELGPTLPGAPSVDVALDRAATRARRRHT